MLSFIEASTPWKQNTFQRTEQTKTKNKSYSNETNKKLQFKHKILTAAKIQRTDRWVRSVL